ncbi:unnamed protein product [Trichobilharzia regenti]|nr:unnamed protein product [Trichobilharzia regenti]
MILAYFDNSTTLFLFSTAHLHNITIYPPGYINIFNITSASFIVSWSSPLNDANQHYVTGYEILLTSGSLKPSRSTSGSSWVIAAVKGVSNGEKFQEKIENLISCKLYTIQMRSVIDSAETVYSEWSKPVSTFTSVTGKFAVLYFSVLLITLYYYYYLQVEGILPLEIILSGLDAMGPF